MSKNFQDIILKLNEFIRKYYLNKLLKGLIISLSAVLSFYLFVTVFEYFYELSSVGRTVIFYSLIAFILLIFLYFIAIPLVRLLKLGKQISHEQAAQIIGKFFPTVDDSLFNTLQLAKLSHETQINISILEASIEQRSAQLKLVPFAKAIPLKANKKFLRYLLPPVFIIVFFLFAWPRVITDSTNRIINHQYEFVHQYPFKIRIENKSLVAVQNEDFELKLIVEGKELPSEIILKIGEFNFKLKSEDLVHFKYVFKSVSGPVDFNILADEYQSPNYRITIIPKPAILGFSVRADYPAYTQKPFEIFDNVGDLTVPVGTKLSWKLFTRDAVELKWFLNDSLFQKANTQKNQVVFARTVYKSAAFKFLPTNSFISNQDTLKFQIEALIDKFPTIQLNQFQDSISETKIYFNGVVKDDYGFTSLKFVYKNKNTETTEKQTITIPVKSTYFQFYHYFDIGKINSNELGEIEYYFEVVDNDGVNGPKSTKSQVFTYKKPSEKEIEQAIESRSNSLNKNFNLAISEANKLKKEIDKLQEKISNQKDLNWQDKEAIKNLLKKYEELQKRVDDIRKEYEIKNQKDQEFKLENERIAEKQKQIEELLNKILTPEMKEIMAEMQKLLEKEMQKEEAQKILDQMKSENKELEKQLDRNLELFKQMEFDVKLQSTIDKLDELQKKQEQLSKETENKSAPSQVLKEKQEKLNQEFDKIKEGIQEIKKANEALEKPNNFNEMKQEQQDIENSMEKSLEQLKENKTSPASKSQKSSSEQMKSLADQMKSQQESMEQESNEEDMAALRDILENLIESSFNQEKLMQKLSNTPKTDPKYPSIIAQQKKIKNDLAMIEDSLLALSKRQASIQPFINREIGEINRNLELCLTALSDMNTIGYTPEQDRLNALSKQQYILISINNLALMLDESLKQMQQQQQQQKSGKGKKCSKPKPGPGMSSLKKMQQQMQKQMEDLLGKQKAGKQDGNKNQGQGNKMSEEYSRLAAQQEALRRKVQEYQEQLKKEGQGAEAQKLNKMIQEMENTETELVNRMISEQSIKRQEDILSKMLEAEKAEREREEKDERESNEANDNYQSNFDKFIEYNKQRNQEVELLKTIPPQMKPFYKNKVNQYFESLQFK